MLMDFQAPGYPYFLEKNDEMKYSPLFYLYPLVLSSSCPAPTTDTRGRATEVGQRCCHAQDRLLCKHLQPLN